MYLVRWILAVFLILVSMATWLPKIEIFGVGPDLLFGAVFLVSLQRGLHWGVWTGVAIGLLIGVERPDTLGADALALALAAWVTARSALGVDRNSPFTQVLLLFLAAVLAETVRVFFLAGSDPAAAPLIWVRWSLPGAVYTTLILPPLAWLACLILGTRKWLAVAP